MQSDSSRPARVINFGRNVGFVPRVIERPGSEAEVRTLLERHRGERIRVCGSKHSWSRILASTSVLVDLGALDSIEIHEMATGETEVTVGAGCKLSRLLEVLNESADATLPAIGGVTEQTVAGAISTGTHGSGQHSISHEVCEVRALAYERGVVVEQVFSSGDELAAARCGLGCFGVIVSVRLRCVRQYHVKERVRRYDSIGPLLRSREAEPLQYFILLPFDWRFVAFHRHALASRPGWRARFYAALRRLQTLVFVDHLFHWSLSRFDRLLRNPSLLRLTYRVAAPLLLLRKRAKVDRSDRALTLNHHFYRHVELELAVPANDIAAAAAVIRHITESFAGLDSEAPSHVEQAIAAADLQDELKAARGTFTLNYPLSFRYVRADDTLMSQSSHGPVYTVSFFSYATENAEFERYASLLTRCLARVYGARPHFGKLFYLRGADVRELYRAKRGAFVDVLDDVDPERLFRNDFVDGVLSC